MKLSSDDFPEFFEALWSHPPFPWQTRLAKMICEGKWPEFIELPTASGKTACLDVAIFALAVQAERPLEERSIGRRVFFVVNRRVIVDQARHRASSIARALAVARRGSILDRVASALREISGDDTAPPLDFATMRGGIVRDNRWARSITQPTIITSTVDQVGSRLLFRGYGVSEFARPMHAALVAHDSTIILDEAHISQPFVQTLQAVRQFQDADWAITPLKAPFRLVQMTATPPSAAHNVFRLASDDRLDARLQKRHQCSKPVELAVATKAKGAKSLEELAQAVAEKAFALQDGTRRNIAIIVNRVATARLAFERLSDLLKSDLAPKCDVYLAIGRMRPLDRDDMTIAIQERIGGGEHDNPAQVKPMFVVATQCLEVGADFDFDAMVSECAPIDALRQRFGRLNRTGREITAKGCIIIRADQVNSDEDPIYDSALSATWRWLQSTEASGVVDFGVTHLDQHLNGAEIASLLSRPATAPVMFPAYVDAWAQTSPSPSADPDVSIFLHGPQRGDPDVNVCWRGDLTSQNKPNWAEIVSLCPPSSPECMAVPLWIVRNWLTDAPDAESYDGDLLEATLSDTETIHAGISRDCLLWRGADHSLIIEDVNQLRPGDTIVLPGESSTPELFGHCPLNSPLDRAEEAYRKTRGRLLMRLTPATIDHWSSQCNVPTDLKKWTIDSENALRLPEIRTLLQETANAIFEDCPRDAELLRELSARSNGLEYQRVPRYGVVLTTKNRVDRSTWFLPAMDDGEDETSRVSGKSRVQLSAHLQHVRFEVENALRLLPLARWGESLRIAADLHDWGKADDRFQALLVNGDRADAYEQPCLWAKSALLPLSKDERRAARMRAEMPDGFRHEMLSVQLVEALPQLLSDDKVQRDLVLHLIAAHHGRGRPFAPVVIDMEPPDISATQLHERLVLSAQARKDHPAHRIDSGVAERFWSLSRHFGWWGLAYLEAVLRLSDQSASAKESFAHNGSKVYEIIQELVT